VVEFDCDPEQSVLGAAKDLGEPRETSRALLRNNRVFGSLPYQTAPLPKTRELKAPGGNDNGEA